jgi:hypothetical protein
MPPQNPYQQPDYGPPQPVPYFLDPNGPYADIGEPLEKSHKGRWIVLSIFMLLIIGGGSSFLLYASRPPSSSQIFQQSLAIALQTQSYTQTETSSSGKDTLQRKNDVSNIREPKQSGTANLSSLGMQIDGYATAKDNFIRFAVKATGIPDTLTAKWIQLRKDGVSPKNAGKKTSYEVVYDGRRAVLGDYLTGNFSAADRQALLTTIQTKQVYRFDPKSVKKLTVNKQSVIQYDVTINADALKALNKQAGAMMGLPANEVDDLIASSSIGQTTHATFMIDNATQRLIKITDNNGSITYGGFNATKVGDRPQADLQYAQFAVLLANNGAPTVTPTPIDNPQLNEAADGERRVDINIIDAHLQAYFAKNQRYPTLTEMNDAGWVSENLNGMSFTVLSDPQASTQQFADKPTVHQYAYMVYKNEAREACDNVSAICQEYQVTATLSDGSTYGRGTTD